MDLSAHEHMEKLIRSHHLHLQWKFKLWAGKFAWGVKAKHCWALSTNFWKQKVCWHHPAMFCPITSSESKPRWSRGSVPSSHARGQRFKPWSRQYLFIRRSLSWFGLASTPVESLPNLNPAFLLSTSRPFNRWPSVWFGSMLCGISMRLHGLEGDFQWW